jgi:hypothetical protein
MLVVRGRLEVNSMAIVALEAGKLQLYHRVMVLDCKAMLIGGVSIFVWLYQNRMGRLDRRMTDDVE